MKDTPKDIIDVLIPPKVDEEDDEKIEKSETEYEEKHDPEHPYCTNWPVNKKKEKKNENI